MPPQLNGRTVIYIDDEPPHARNYIEALKEGGYKVEPRYTPDGGRKQLIDHAAEYDVLVLDMQMPTPQGVSPLDTEHDQFTGIWVLLQCREVIEEHGIRVFVFTNKQRKAVLEQINERVAPLNWTLVVKTKTEVNAVDLPGEIDKLF